jgi:hypothetical protein
MQTGVVEPDGKHVSSGFLDACAKLQFPPANRPVIFMHAVLLTHASDPSVVDGVCRGISHGDVNAMATKYKQAVLKNNLVLKNAREMSMSANISEHARRSMLLELYRRVVHITIQRKDIEKGYSTVDQCVEAFVKRLSAAQDGSATVAGASSSSSDATPATESAALTNVVEYDLVGNAVGAYTMTLKESGFSDDKFISLKKDPEGQNTHFKIKSISDVDGSVNISKVNILGQVESDIINVPHKEFLKMYKPVNTKIEVYAYYPEKAADKCIKVVNNSIQSCVLQCIEKLQRKYPLSYKLIIHTAPQGRVYADDDFTEGAVTFAPITLGVTMEVDPRKQLAPTAHVATVVGSEIRFVLAKMSATKDFVAPFWQMSTTSNKDVANFELQTVQFQCNEPVDIQKAARQKRIVTLPIAVNTKPISKGTEMILYRVVEKSESKEKDDKMVVDGKRAAKKSRIA